MKALQGVYGLSYKDAAHRLYHSEVQKLMLIEKVQDSRSKMHDEIQEARLNIQKEIAEIHDSARNGP